MGYTKGVYLATDATGWSSFTAKLDTGSSSGWANQQGGGATGYPQAGQNGDGTRYIYVSKQVGASDSNPGTAASPKLSLFAGLGLLRDGRPDWLMLRKGDTWTGENFADISHPNGLDANNLMLVTAYDPANPSVANPATGGAPPIVQTDHTETSFLFDFGNFFGLVGVTAYAYTRDPNNGAYSAVSHLADAFYTHQGVSTIIVEDCEFSYYTTGPGFPATSSGKLMDDILVRRSVVYNSYTTTSDHSVGLESQGQVSNMIFEEVASNHNGWLGTLDGFSRGFYLGVAGESQFNNPATVRGCIIANDSSETQVRGGGYIYNNLGFNNQGCCNTPPIEASISYIYKNNVNLTSTDGANLGGWGTNNALGVGAMEISGNIFSHESGSSRRAIAVGAGSNGFNTHDNIVYKWTTPYVSAVGCPISFDTIVGGSGFTTGNDFYFTMASGGMSQSTAYSDGLGNIFETNEQLGTLATTFFYTTRTTTGSNPAQSGTLTRTSGSGPATVTYTNVYRIFYNIDMSYVTGSGGTGLGCTMYANMSGAIVNVLLATGVASLLHSPGGNYNQLGQNYSHGDQVTNTSSFGGGTGFSCKVNAVGINTHTIGKYDPTGSLHAGGSFPEWIDPERSIATYAASIGLAGTEAAFLEAVRTNRKWNWDPRYTANAANNYFRAGFGIGSDTVPPVLMAQICM